MKIPFGEPRPAMIRAFETAKDYIDISKSGNDQVKLTAGRESRSLIGETVFLFPKELAHELIEFFGPGLRSGNTSPVHEKRRNGLTAEYILSIRHCDGVTTLVARCTLRHDSFPEYSSDEMSLLLTFQSSLCSRISMAINSTLRSKEST